MRFFLVAIASLLLAPAGLAGASSTPAPRAGDVLGTLVIPRLGLRVPLVEGTAHSQLRRGSGHYPWTWLPGQGEVVAIAGHRTLAGAPFRRLDRIRRRDVIALRMSPRFGGRTYSYRVSGTAVMPPNRNRWLVRDLGYERLVLSTCHPLGSAALRYIVHALPSAN